MFFYVCLLVQLLCGLFNTTMAVIEFYNLDPAWMVMTSWAASAACFYFTLGTWTGQKEHLKRMAELEDEHQEFMARIESYYGGGDHASPIWHLPKE